MDEPGLGRCCLLLCSAPATQPHTGSLFPSALHAKEADHELAVPSDVFPSLLGLRKAHRSSEHFNKCLAPALPGSISQGTEQNPHPGWRNGCSETPTGCCRHWFGGGNVGELHLDTTRAEGRWLEGLGTPVGCTGQAHSQSPLLVMGAEPDPVQQTQRSSCGAA